MKKNAVIVSGYFNPLHKGHIEYFHKARSLGDYLIVIVNNDKQRELKRSKEFMDEKERLLIIDELKITDKVILSIDLDLTVNQTIKLIHSKFSKQFNLIFANGGDQNNSKIPEYKTCIKFDIKMSDGLGKKIQSSSWLLKE